MFTHPITHPIGDPVAYPISTPVGYGSDRPRNYNYRPIAEDQKTLVVIFVHDVTVRTARGTAE